ncbi:MAG: hypothetical protein ACRDCN_06170, partial [Tannerellaceae bacterium]
MKKLRYIFCLLQLLLIFACSNGNESLPIESDESQLLSFRIAVPELEIQTRGIASDPGLDANKFYLLVFDENGLFLQRAKATLTGQNTFQVSINRSQKKRIIHFIGNYDFNGFSDIAHSYKSEKEIIPSLEMNGKVAYWQRKEYNSGIQAEKSFSEAVELIRNVAKISVVNNTTSTYPRLDSITFAVVNQNSYGSVAPFNKSNGLFIIGSITEGNTEGILPMTVFDAQDKYLYEKQNVESNTPLTVLIKGKYKATETSMLQDHYYKIDLVNDNASCQTVLFNIERNNSYIIKLNQVLKEGYSTVEAALNSPSANNLINSIELQPIKNISDGKAVLSVSDVFVIMVRENAKYTFSYNYYPDGTGGSVDNLGAHVTLNHSDPSNPIAILQPSVAGSIELQTNRFSVTESAEGYIHVCKNGLSRKIKLLFRKPFLFSEVFTTMQGTLGQNKPVSLQFTIPTSIAQSEFPMLIYILAPKLSPAPNSGLK